MIKIICAVLIIIFSSVLTVPVCAAEESDAPAYTVYVDANAGDDGDGTAKKPFNTISKAKEKVRTLDKESGDIEVEIAGGFYEQEETLEFTVEDGGSEGCEIRYVAAKGVYPVISGGKKLSGTWKEEGGGIYSIPLERDKKLRSLYVNGQRCYMTSKQIKAWGGYGSYEIEKNDGYAWVSGTATAGVKLTAGSIPLDTRNQEDIELMTKTRWNTTIVCVESLENKGAFVGAKLQMPYGAIAQTLGWGNEYQFKEENTVYNVFEWLDEPGEFYFDKAGKTLYYYPREGEDLSEAEVVVPELDTIINIEGENLSSRVKNLSFEGLTFAYTDFSLCEVEGSYGRATNQGAATLKAYAEEDWHGYLYRAYDTDPSAVQIASAENITFTDNEICHTGSEGISLINDVTNAIFTANAVYDTGGSALLIGHPQHAYIGDKNSGKGNHSEKEKYGAEEEGLCKNITVSDNLFRDTSRLFWGAAGVMVYFCHELDFTHNLVENTPYSGISLGWGWWNLNGSEQAVVPGEPCTSMKNNDISRNKFVNTITVLSDAGAVYTIGDMPGTTINENHIDGIGEGNDLVYHIRGIHIDEGTRHVYGEKNVIDIDPDFTCIDCGDWGNKGDNRWDNNYSTSSSYTTTQTYEPGTVITNAHTVEDGQWDETALAVMRAAGIREEYKEKVYSAAVNDYIKNLPAQAKPSGLSAGEIAAIVIGAAVFVAAATALMVLVKKRKKKSADKNAAQ